MESAKRNNHPGGFRAEFSGTDGKGAFEDAVELTWLGRDGTHHGEIDAVLLHVGKLSIQSTVAGGREQAMQFFKHSVYSALGHGDGKVVRMEIDYH